MRKKPSTDYCPQAVPLSVYAPDFLDRIYESFGLGADEHTPAALERAMAGTVEQRLGERSALELVTLEFVVESGGLADRGEVIEEVAWRTELPEAVVEFAVSNLEQTTLLVPVYRGESDRPSLALHSADAEQIAARVYGVSLPDRVAAARAESARRPGLIGALAAAGLAIHHTVTSTRAGAPHRGNIKKHARRIGCDAEVLFESLMEALDLGILSERSGCFIASTERMVAVASGGGRKSALCGWVGAHVVSAEELSRAIAIVRARLSSARWLELDHLYAEQVVKLRADTAGGVYDDQLTRFEVDGAWHLANFAAPPESASVEGFVTPNLEVMIGPDPDPLAVAQIAVAADLVKLDRVLTFQLRPATIARAVMHGVGGPDLVRRLERVGRHGLPESVRAQVLDWAESAPIARASPMTLLEVPRRFQDAVVEALGGRARAIAPDQLLISTAVGHGELERVLMKLKVELGGEVAPPPPPIGSPPTSFEDDQGFRLPPRPVFPMPATPAEDLRLRVLKERRVGFGPNTARLGGAQGPTPEMLREAAEFLPTGPRKALNLLIRLFEENEPALRGWAARQPGHLRGDADALVDNPVSAMLLLVLPRKRRNELLRGDTEPSAVRERAQRLIAHRKLSAAGRKIGRAFSMSALEGMFGVAAPASFAVSPRAALEEAVETGGWVQLTWIAQAGERERIVTIDAVREIGADVRVFVTDVGTDESWVVPLRTITRSAALR